MISVSNPLPLFPILQRRNRAAVFLMPATLGTSPRPGTRSSTRLTRTAAGSLQLQSPCNASSWTLTRTLRSRNWTAGKKKNIDSTHTEYKYRVLLSAEYCASTDLSWQKGCWVYSLNLLPLSSCSSWLLPSHNNLSETSLGPLSLIIKSNYATLLFWDRVFPQIGGFVVQGSCCFFFFFFFGCLCFIVRWEE